MRLLLTGCAMGLNLFLPTIAHATTSNSTAPRTAAAVQPVGRPISTAKPVAGADFTNQLLAELLDRNTEQKLYEQGNNPWPGGAYKFEVFKDGKPVVSNGGTQINVKLPMKISIAGDVGNTLLNFKMACTASFSVIGEVLIKPVKVGTVTPLKSQITLPIPPVNALCDGAPVPIDTYLKNLFDQNKLRLEAELDAKMNVWLADKK